jgi:hypothetical protein
MICPDPCSAGRRDPRGLHLLDATPPPICLADANSQLRTGLGLQAKGLDLSAQAVSQRDRLKLAQGAMLFTVSNWSITQAVRSSRGSHC